MRGFARRRCKVTRVRVIRPLVTACLIVPFFIRGAATTGTTTAATTTSRAPAASSSAAPSATSAPTNSTTTSSAQVRQALLDPRQLIAGERAVITNTPLDENELIAGQLTRLTSAMQTTERERTRLLDAYQAEVLGLDEITRRTAHLTARRYQLAREKDTLTRRSRELASENRLRRGLAHLAERVAASLDELDFDARQHLLRLIVEKVRVTGWHVEIHLKIPLANDDPGDDRAPRTPSPTTDRPAIWACVPLVDTDGTDSYRLAQATAGTGVRPLA